ncbi:MAG: hypothetical protein J1F25_05505, partial [Prevotellaceae bacterium]|nr:hypothetical protein [Prevotellaceae bacterium]
MLVIAGHVFSQPQFSANTSCIAMHQWIYVFHMPLFIFISGYFSRKKDYKHFLLDCWRLLEPLIIFQLLNLGLKYRWEGYISIKDVLTPWWILWYLLSLIYWRALLQIIPKKILQNTKLLIVASFAICILVGFLPFNRFLSLQRTFSFLPFFFLGYCLKEKNLFIL